MCHSFLKQATRRTEKFRKFDDVMQMKRFAMLTDASIIFIRLQFEYDNAPLNGMLTGSSISVGLCIDKVCKTTSFSVGICAREDASTLKNFSFFFFVAQNKKSFHR